MNGDFNLIDHPSVDDPHNTIRQNREQQQQQYDNNNSRFQNPGNHNRFSYDDNDDDDYDILDPPNNHNNNPYGEGNSIPYSESRNTLTPAYSAQQGGTAGYFEGTGIAADLGDPRDDEDILAGSRLHQRQDPRAKGGLTGLYSSVKNKLGMSQQHGGYSEMDLPLTERGAQAQRPTERADTSSTLEGGRKGADDEDNKDSQFDVRKIYNKILRRKEVDPATLGPRIIELNNATQNTSAGYKDNHISTTKYNFATFLPKFLFEQFSKYANLFFLFTSAIQQVPNVSPTNRYTTIGTLAVVLSVSAVKELVEDVKRSNADKELNNSTVEVLNSQSQFEKKRWIKVQVGDVVRVNSEEPFPADILLLASSEPEGLCYIETANLDGETNLKIKQALNETAHLVNPHELRSLRGRVLSEQPNSQLYSYDATLELEQDGQKQKISLSPDQMLLRGATLRNTPWVHGLVVFTGHETKLMRNATAAPIKRTAVEHMLNLQIIFLFSILIVLAIVSAMGDVIKMKTSGDSMTYLMIEGTSRAKQFFLDILTYWVLFSNLVPISLFVTVEIVKFYQAYLISSDLDMYYKETDTPAVCRTSSLVEELGQIEYIFSDKTGTLTRNMMEFKSCSIAGRCYASEIPDDKKATVIDGVEVGYHPFDVLREDMEDMSTSGQVIQEFFTLLASCHTVIPENTKSGKIKYQAASPDEGALVEGASQLGFRFVIRRPKSITIDIRGENYEYELLNILEFNSTRKRMSAIFRCPDGKIRLYCKGADTVIMERLAPDNPFITPTMSHLEDFAGEGLRTLCLAMRVVPEDEYAEWAQVFNEASTTLENRGEKLDDAAEMIEQEMFLLGATAIEDKLQEGVPETIHTLQDAGIKVWVLTGDRQETAINIGMSCKLLSEDMNLLIVNEDNFEGVRDNLRKKAAAIANNQLGASDYDSMALIIDGKSLGFALDKNLEKDFLNLAVLCKAVICCRVSPLQKALVVKLVKRSLKSLLLAVGDGANDVSMIQAAHVGVGISGMEGMQAARSADVSIGQFRYLRKLLLVHGAWSYQRLSQAILYSFYKNIALYMTQFWFVFLNGFSGQSVYESWTITFYNVFFTVLPPFVLGVFDQFISARLLDRYAQLYQLGQKGTFFNVRHFWEWILNGFYHSLILFVGSIYTYKWGHAFSTNGMIGDHWTWGTALYTACVLTALGKAALITSMWNKFTVLAIPGSFLLWLGFFPAYATIAPLINVSTEYRGILQHLYPTLAFWAMIIVLPCMCLIRDVAWKYYKRMYRPDSYHHVQEIQKYNIADYRPRMEQFQKAIRKVRQVQRMRKQRGFAFSQADEGGQERVVRAYDTTQARGRYGEMKTGHQ